MPTIVLTTTNASPQTWSLPEDAPAGTVLTVECWGAGSGGSGSSTSFRSGGAGGAWAKSLFVVTPDDVANGITYSLQAGTAGTGAANSTAGPDTSFSTHNLNTIPNSNMNGAVVGTPGTLPTGWSYSNSVGLSTQIVGFGLDVTSGLQYIDIRIFGTPTGSGSFTVEFGPVTTPITSSTTYNASVYTQLRAGSLTNVTFWELDYIANTSFTNMVAVSLSPTSTLTRSTGSGSSGSNTQAWLRYQIGCTSGAAIDLTVRTAGLQTEIGSSASAWKSTPGYTLAKGGGATSGTTGGVGGATATSIGTTKHAGGSGATQVQGGGGGGAAGKDAVGTSSTTGTGGTGDSGSGGAAGTDNVEGGGGATAATSPSPAGAPGGGGGASTSTNNGSAAGRGQIRINYSPSLIIPQLCSDVDLQQFLPIMAQ